MIDVKAEFNQQSHGQFDVGILKKHVGNGRFVGCAREATPS